MMNFNKDFGKGCVGADLSRPGRGGETDKPLIHGFPTPPWAGWGIRQTVDPRIPHPTLGGVAKPTNR
jgi:hypothetical protein